MKKIVLIGGTGAAQVVPPENTIINVGTTPHGKPSSPILEWQTGDLNFAYMARHGPDGTIPPHLVNYKANLWIVRELQPDCVIGLNAVGGIADVAHPARLIFPDQLIDYTWGREHTFADVIGEPVKHIDFTEPLSGELRRQLANKSDRLSLDFIDGGTCGVTQGPRLETAAEIDRLEKDGCHIVGMTALPEAALARELGLDYVICAIVVNWAAGRGPAGTDMHAQMQQHVAGGMSQVERLLVEL